MTNPAHAGNSLPSTTARFAGAFQTNDANGANCVNPNNLSNSCTCPGSTEPAYRLRILNDSSGANIVTGGNFQVCSVGQTGTTSEFFGAYQTDDPVPGGLTCRVKNGVTGACSCPAGSTDLAYRGLADTSTGSLVGTNIHICTKITGTPTYYGGAYQIKDSGVCTHANPDTGACSCPANFEPQKIRSMLAVGGGADAASTINICVPKRKNVTICPGVSADPTGNVAASDALQACVNATPAGGTLAIPAGTYLVNNKIEINKPMSLRTATVSDSEIQCGKSVPCATLLASSNFSGINGMLYVPHFGGVYIDHIAIDGNRFARLASDNARRCVDPNTFGGTLYGYNAQVMNCPGCKFTNSYSARALCGTGMEWNGDSATINNNLFVSNGDHETRLLWADGLTIHNANDSVIVNNTIVDSTDVGLMMGRLERSYVKSNMILQQRARTYAAFMISSFNSPNLGVYTNADMSFNYIGCEPGKCFYAVNLGGHAWKGDEPYIEGGTFANNTIVGGVIGLNVEGAGGGKPLITIYGNTITANQPDGVTTRCHPSSATPTVFSTRYNLGPDSMVTGTQVPTSRQETHNCIGD